ncbi:SpoIIE family protein phosphatase [Streptomyces lonarensis]|uniref:protein-serine/threonine phosphatase n=1 Tax=Streptomyces lonarensis TaxID=700599 RepID=A0A7X6D3X0_9ACTN|nr:SpoIIE family protein phosphatase [Streptomyces lonarensis]NJQ07712.1 SpoIIE family protein phosphatase [Streptomyces lonarensis]
MAGDGEQRRGGPAGDGTDGGPVPPPGGDAAAYFATDDGGVVRQWSGEAAALLGRTAASVLGTRAALLADPAHRDRAQRWFGSAATAAGAGAVVLPAVRGDGRTVLLSLSGRLLTGEADGVLVLVRAADAGRDADAEPALAAGLVDQSPVGLGMVGPDLHWLRANPALARINGTTGRDLLGRAIGEAGQGVDTPEVAATMRRVLADGEAVSDRQITGTTPADPDAEHVWSASFHRVRDAAGRTLGAATSVVDVTARHRAGAEVAAAREQLAMIAEAGRRIGTTLDLQHTAQELADVIVPRLADLAAVDVLDSVFSGEVVPPVAEDGSARFRALAVASRSDHSGAERAADRVGGLVSYGPHRPITQCVAEARPVLMPEVGPRTLRRIARDERAAAVLAASGVHSYLAVPLVARGDILGTLSLCRTAATPRPFDERDLELAVDLAGRAAICVDNARLYSREHNAALALQRGLLPRIPDHPLALDLAFRYLPAVREVGGDWFDVLPLRGGRIGLMVGDVMGKGVQAAAIMGQLRSTTRALARLDLPPAELLDHLDATAEFLGDSIATCVYAVYDPAGGHCEIAVAGHPPPVLVSPAGRARFLDAPVAAPLGVGAGGFAALRCELPGDATLALFTDGLVESRRAPIDTGLDRLLRLLDGRPRPLEETCDRVLDALDGAAQDDIALLLARPFPAPAAAPR